MRRTNDKSLKEAIEQMLQVYKLKRRFDETSLIACWPELLGKAVANRTKQLYIRDRKLFIRLESAVVKSELLMIRSQILDKLNEKAGSNVLDEIVFL
jgi:predicted nucleic acid-binding Zn ribbon protein